MTAEDNAAEVPNYVDRTMFKFYGETTGDIFQFLVRLYERGDFHVPLLSYSVVDGVGGANVTLRVLKVNPNRGSDGPYHVPATLSELREAAADLVDCHYIYESLNYAQDFTGERYHPYSKREPRLVVKSVKQKD